MPRTTDHPPPRGGPAAPLKALGIQSPDTVVALVALNLVGWRERAAQTDWGVLILFGGGLALGEVLGLWGALLVVLVALAASCGFALPVATPPNALVFGTGQVSARRMMRAGLVLDVVCVLMLATAGWLAVRAGAF